MSELYFVEPTPEAFVASLVTLYAKNAARIVLVGLNSLAREILSFSEKSELSIEYYSSLELVDIDESSVLVFTATSGAELSEYLTSCIDRPDLVVVAPITDWHFSKKPLFLVSIPKSGTHLLYELVKALGYHAGVEIPEFPAGQTWYCIEYTNSHTVARDFFVDTVRRSPFGNRHHCFTHSPTLFMYRHPLDILLSEAHYYHKEGKTIFAGWLDGLDFDERVSRLLNDNWLIGSLRERIGGYLPWLDFPNVISLSFEELIGAAGGGTDADQLLLIWSIQLKLQIPGNSRDIASHIFNPDSATFRSGKLGAFKNSLPSKVINDFIINNEDILTKLGYPIDGTVCLPVNREIRRKQEIKYSQVDYENMPINNESNYLGCNLVRYSKQFYAIPITAGQVSLESLRDDVLAAIPSAPTLNEIKSILLMGGDEIAFRRQSLTQLAMAIIESDPTLATNQYWSVLSKPTIFDEYLVYTNAGQVLAVKMGKEVIDFEDAAAVEDWLSDGRLIKAATMDGVRAAIERQRDRTKLDTRLDELEQRLAQALERVVQRLSEISPLSNETSLLEEGYLGYNILSNAGRVWAAEIAAGVIDFEDAAAVEIWLSDGRLLKAATMDGVRAAIERQCDRKDFDRRLDALEQQLVQGQERLARRLSVISPLDNETSLLEEGYLGYNILSYAGRVWAAEITEGVIDFENAAAVEDWLSDGRLLKAATTDGVRAAIERQCDRKNFDRRLDELEQRLSEISPLNNETCLLEEGYLGFNILSYAGRVWAAEIAAGVIDFEDAAAVEDWLSDGRLLQASTVDGAKSAVERQCDRRNFDAKLERYVGELTAQIQSGLQDIAKQGDIRMKSIEQTLGHRQEMHAQHIEHRLFILEHPWLHLIQKLRKKMK